MKLNYTLKSLFILLALNSYIYTMEAPSPEDKNIKQVKALIQRDGGECGYHALYNAIIIAKSLQNPSLLALIETDKDQKELFGSLNSSWKNQIILKRVETLAKYYIADTLLNMVKDTMCVLTASENTYQLNLSSSYIKLKPVTRDNSGVTFLDEEREILCNIISNIAKDLAQNKVNNQPNKYSYNIEPNQIVNAFKQELTRRFNQNGRALYRILSSDDKILKCFPKIKAINFDIIFDHEIRDSRTGQTIHIVDWSNTNKRERAFKSVKPAEWLSSEELEHLIEYQKNHTNLEIPRDLKIFCLEGEIKEQFNLNDNLKSLALSFQDINYAGTAAFLIYYPQHWVTCVVTKNKSEKPQFIFADSLNIDRTKSDQALTLINILSSSNYCETENRETKSETSNNTNQSNAAEFEQEEAQEERENLTTKSYRSISEDKLPPLDLLLDRNDFLNTKILISKLKEKKAQKKSSSKKGLLLYGPPGTGKFCTAYIISKLSGWNFISIESKSLVSKKDQESRLIKLLSELFNKIKVISPAILFIHKIENLADATCDDSDNSLLQIFYDKLNNFKNQSLIFLIASTHNPQLAKNKILKELLSPIAFILPDHSRCMKILEHHGNNELPESIEVTIPEMVASCAEGFSGYDLYKVIKKTSALIKENIDVKVNFWNNRFYNQYDFQNSPWQSTLYCFPPVTCGVLLNGFMFSNNDKRMLVAYELQKEELLKRKDPSSYKDKFSDSNWAETKKGKVAIFFLDIAKDAFTEAAKAKAEETFKKYADWAEEKASDKVREWWNK